MLRDVLILAVSIIILSLLIFLLYTSYVGSEIPRKAKVIVIFRMDDIQPNWKFHALRKGVDLFIEEKVPITLGVIPNVGGKLKVSEDPPSLFLYKKAPPHEIQPCRNCSPWLDSRY